MTLKSPKFNEKQQKKCSKTNKCFYQHDLHQKYGILEGFC